MIQRPVRTRQGLTRRRFLGTSLGVGTALSLPACGTDGGFGRSTSDTLKWAWDLPTSWDPITSSAGWDVHGLSLVYSALTMLDEDGTAKPALAHTWTYDKDGTGVVFQLRKGLTFSDGSPLDATAVRKSLERGRDDKGSLVAAQLLNLGKVRALDPLTVRLEFTEPDFQYPALLAGKTGMVVNPRAFETDAAALATEPAGSGPFVLQSYVQNSKAVLVRNEGYWDRQSIDVARFELYPLAEGATVVASLQSGQFNVAEIPPSQVEAAQKAGLDVQVIPSMVIGVLDVHVGKAPFDDPAVVEAIKLGINRQELVDTAQFGHGEVSYQPFPQGYVAHDDSLTDTYAYDPDKARNLLAGAGYDDGLDITLSTYEPEGVPELIQAQLADIGIRVTLESIPETRTTQLVYIQHKKSLYDDKFAGRESPVQAYQVLFGKDGLMNIGGTTSPELEDAVDVVRRTPLDSPEYPKVVQAATAAAVHNCPNVFLHTVPRILARNPSVSKVPEYKVVQRFEGVTVA